MLVGRGDRSAQGPSTQRPAPRAAPPPGRPGTITRRPAIAHSSHGDRARRSGRRQERSSPDMMSRLSPARRPAAPLALAARAADARRRRRRQAGDPRLYCGTNGCPTTLQPRPAHRRRGLPHLRLPAPPRLTPGRVTPDGATAGSPRRGRVVDGPWITRRRAPNLVDRPPCGPRPRRAIIRSARRGRDERTAVPPQGGRAPRKGSRILRKEGRPFRKGGGAVRRSHRCRKAPGPLARAGGAPQGAPQPPARVASSPQGGRGDRVGGPFGRFAVRAPPAAGGRHPAPRM